MFRKLTAAVGAVVVLSVAGCAPGTLGAPQASEPVVTHPSPSATPTPTPTPTAARGATWGDTITLPSGLAFTVAYVGVKPATHYAEDGKYSGKTAVFKTTLRNGTTQSIDTGSWTLAGATTTAGSDGHNAPQNGWDGYTWPQSPKLAPGEVYTWEFGVDDTPANLKALRVEYSVPAYLGGGASPVVWRGDVP